MNSSVFSAQDQYIITTEGCKITKERSTSFAGIEASALAIFLETKTDRIEEWCAESAREILEKSYSCPGINS